MKDSSLISNQQDRDVIQNGRKNALKDIEVPLRERVIQKLRKKLVDAGIGERVVSNWNQGNSDRAEWLERQRAYLTEYDEMIKQIYDAGSNWGSALHLPVTLTVGKAYHARMLAALLSIDPPLTVKAQKGVNADRALLVQELMGHALRDWSNRHKGIDSFADKWLWDWVFSGDAVAKVRWETEYTRYMDVEEGQEVVGTQAVTDPQTGQQVVVPRTQQVEREVERVKKCFDGPCIKNINLEDILVVGGDGDPQEADCVIEQAYLTASELWTNVDRGVFDEDAVEKVIEGGKNNKGSEPANLIKVSRTEIAGEASLDKTYETERYHILEAYMKVDVDGSGIASDVIVWVHKETREVLRATYLYRISPTGKRPYYRITFHRRKGSEHGVGLVELLYSLQKEIDTIHNIKLDVGILSSQPFGFYRPSSSVAEENLPIEPGALIPMDNPQTDVYFPQLGSRWAFGVQEEQALMQYVERLTSVNDMTLGSMASQGASRTATGARGLMQETTANLDVFIRRMHIGWRGILYHLFELLQQRIEPGYMFRVLADDGADLWATINDPEQIKGSFDFVLEANSSRSNNQMQVDQAQQIYQLTANPLDLQLGLITPAERYEAIKNLLKTLGIKNFSRFVRKPPQGPRLNPEDIANMALAGIPYTLSPQDDLQGFVDYVQYILDHDEILGQFNEDQTVKLAQKQQEAGQLLEALQSQQAAVANQMQQQANAQQAGGMGGGGQMGSAPEAQGAPAPGAEAAPMVQ